jgi:glycosyltransferase involved in cell wall biosynthesis
MRILYRHRTRSRDGQAVHIEEMIAALRRRGHEIEVSAPAATTAADFGADAGLVARLKQHLPRFLYELLELAYSLAEYRRGAAAIARQRPDVIYERANLFSLAGVWLKRRNGLKLLVEVNAPLAEERGKFGGLALPSLARWSEEKLWRSADAVLPVTQVLADMVEKAGVKRERIAVIPNGIDPAHLGNCDSIAVRRALGLEGKLILGFVGFVREWHRVDQVIELLADPTTPANAHLLLIGDGPALPELDAQARCLGIRDRVTMTGVVARDKIMDHVAAFDIALQPHVVAYASPLKLFEYMALGCAIVAPDTANIREILAHEDSALLFASGDGASFRGALKRLIADPDLRKRLGASARATIDTRDLTWDANARRVEAIVQNLPNLPHSLSLRAQTP